MSRLEAKTTSLLPAPSVHAGNGDFRSRPGSSVRYQPVSETVEDHSPQTPLVYAKLEDQLAALERLIALEMLVAAQAVDLRKPARLGASSATLHATIRGAVPALSEDRENGPDVERIRALFGTL